MNLSLNQKEYPIFKFVSDYNIVYTAKQKLNNIFIGEGSEIHIRNKENHVARIVQNEIDQLNKIHIGDTHFPLKYIDSGMPHRFSIKVTFPKDDTNCKL